MKYKYKRGDTELITALAQGRGTTEAALLADVHPTTVRNRKLDPAFMKMVSKQRSQYLSQTAGILARVATKAAAKLEELIDGDDTPDHVVQNACRTAMDYTLRLQEGMELSERVDEMEELLEHELSLTGSSG